ncbi:MULTISPECIES: winged helix-turn-helix domain-containing protein [Streptomyces]
MRNRRIELLGPLALKLDGVDVPLTKLRESTALALLALNAGHRISKEKVLRAVWGEDLPATANSQISIIMHNLRGYLDAGKSDVIRTIAGQYVRPALRVGGKARRHRFCAGTATSPRPGR